MGKVFGSIGHGGQDSGAVAGRFIEKNMNLIYGKACIDELSKYVETEISRLGDSFIGLSGLVSMSNNCKAQIHLAFHLNAGGGDGCEIYHSINSIEGKKLAESISKKIAALGQNAHGQYVKVKPSTKNTNKDYYTELGSTNAIAVILEPAFLDSKDVEFVDTEKELKVLGIAVAHGVLEYLRIQIKQEIKPVEPTKAKAKIVVYGNSIDQRAALYLADFFNCKIQDGNIPFNYADYEVYCVGGEPTTNNRKGWTDYRKKIIAGTNRFDTCSKVLSFIKNNGK